MVQASIDENRLALRERDLYEQLLALGRHEELAAFLEDAIDLAVDATRADRAHLMMQDPRRSETTSWSTSRCMSPVETARVRDFIDCTALSEGLASGEIVETDPIRVNESGTVRMHHAGATLGAAICTPMVGRDVKGAIYLERLAQHGPFTLHDRACSMIFGRHLAGLAEELVAKAHLATEDDPTHSLREHFRIDDFVGRSRVVAEVLRSAMLAAPLEVNVLLTGESGTGKTMLARLIHLNSARASGPFVELSCAALPEPLIENELFGARRGAHSTATHKIGGKVAAADGGTLFFDEIGDLPLGAQAKLLQLLQSRQYYPLGSSKPCHANIRVLAATNVDLESRVEQGLFREDLFFRLQVLELRLPSLSERREDLPELAQLACAAATSQYGLPKLVLSASAIRAIETAEWPGNVRQLESAIVSAAIHAAGEGVRDLSARHLFPDRPDAWPDEDRDVAQLGFQERTRLFQRDLLKQTLSDTGWNVAKAARRLHLARSYVYKLIDGFGFKRG